jgi:hypothetical protein
MSEEFTQDSCASCGAAIIWAQLQSSRRIPIDFEPHVQGNVVLSRRPWGVLASPVKAMLAFGRKDLRRSHFATCPKADEHRRQRERSARKLREFAR